MQEMQQRLESGGSVCMADYEAHKQRIAALSLQSPGTPEEQEGVKVGQGGWMCTISFRSQSQLGHNLCMSAMHWHIGKHLKP